MKIGVISILFIPFFLRLPQTRRSPGYCRRDPRLLLEFNPSYRYQQPSRSVERLFYTLQVTEMYEEASFSYLRRTVQLLSLSQDA